MNQSEKRFFSELLQQFRNRKMLSQKQLAELIGVSRETISLWERGYYKPETDTILYELVRVLDLTEQEQQQLFEAYTVTALTVSFHNPPLARNPYFTGRGPQLTNLHSLLLARKQVALTQAISGLGGIGKHNLLWNMPITIRKATTISSGLLLIPMSRLWHHIFVWQPFCTFLNTMNQIKAR